MYILRNKIRNTFYTSDGWTGFNKHGAIEGLDNVIRYTKGEYQANKDKLPDTQEFVWFGCYKELKE